MKVERAKKTGFCFGVRRALDIVEKAGKERGDVATLGQVVHNPHVVQKLSGLGVSVAETVAETSRKHAVISAHGVGPKVKEDLNATAVSVIDATCNHVKRAQQAATRLADDGFFVVVYGDADHPEVKGILGWAGENGLATKDDQVVARLKPLTKKIGLLCQTTQIRADFNDFVKKVIDTSFTRGSEMRLVDTICPDIASRQQSALELAGRVEVMVVVGGNTSANTRHLAELCSRVTQTYRVQSADELKAEWFTGISHVGVTAGASTADETIDEVVAALERIGRQ